MPTLVESIKKLLWSSDSGGASVPVADSGARSANHSVEESASSAVVLLLGSASEKNRHGFSLPDLHKGGVEMSSAHRTEASCAPGAGLRALRREGAPPTAGSESHAVLPARPPPIVMNRMAERQAGFVVAHLADLRGNSELGKVIVVKDEQCVEIDLLRPHPVACAGADAVDGRGDPVRGSDSTRSGRRRASRCVPVQQVDSMLLSLQHISAPC